MIFKNCEPQNCMRIKNNRYTNNKSAMVLNRSEIMTKYKEVSDELINKDGSEEWCCKRWKQCESII